MAGVARLHRSRRFFRDRYDAQRVLQRVVLDVKEAKSLEEVTGEVVKQIHDALHPEFVSQESERFRTKKSIVEERHHMG